MITERFTFSIRELKNNKLSVLTRNIFTFQGSLKKSFDFFFKTNILVYFNYCSLWKSTKYSGIFNSLIKDPTTLYSYVITPKKIFNAYSVFFNQIILNLLVLFLILCCLTSTVYLWTTVFDNNTFIFDLKIIFFIISKIFSCIPLLLLFHIIPHLRNIFNDYTKSKFSRILLNTWFFFFLFNVYNFIGLFII